MSHANPPPAARYAAKVALVAGAYFGSAKFGLTLGFENSSITAVWPPTGIALAALLIWGYRLWPGVALGAFLANSWTGVPLLTVLGITTGNTLEALVGAYLLLRVARFQPELERVRDVVALAVLAGGLSTMVSATVGVASLSLGGALSGDELASAWRVWWLGDMGGDLLVAPALLLLARGLRIDRRPERIAEGGLVLVTLVAVALVTLSQRTGFAYVIFPLVVWAALRFRQRGAAVGSVIVAGIAVYYTSRGMGPFVGGSPDGNLLRSQSFMGVAAITALLLAAVTSERERAKEALRRARDQLELKVRERTHELSEAQRLAHIGSWEWDIAADEVRWSDELYRIYGLEPERFGASYEEFLARVHHDDRPVAESVVAKALSDPGPFEYYHRIVRPDRTVRIVHARGDVVVGEDGVPVHMFGTGQDVTERKEADDALAATHGLLEAILDNSASMIYVLDTDNRFMLINRSCAEFFGLDEDEVVGRSMYDFFPKEIADSFRDNNAQVIEAGRPVEFEERAPRPDGPHTYLAAKFPLLDPAGVPYAVCGITTDITERERAKQEADRLKEGFFALVSHELRTPLSSIKGYVELLIQEKGGAERNARAHEFLETIDRNARRLERLVGDLLFAAQVQSGEFALDSHTVDLGELLPRCVETAAPWAEERDLELTLATEPVPPVTGDEDRLAQLFDNLISNALKYTPDGGRVEITLRREADSALVQVRDTGIGISAADQKHIYERFVRAASATEQAVPGVGLGLTIAKAIVEAHGGRIEIESEEGLGSTVGVELPVRELSESDTDRTRTELAL
jgi:PAS domain S-box-containing protein